MQYLESYHNKINNLMVQQSQHDFDKAISLIRACKARQGKLVFVGNGGSAAIASHLSVDFTNACSIRGVNFNEADLLTCFSNDYGYENWVVEALKSYVDADDLVFLISSSGQSQNILNAADFCEHKGIDLITLSGFSADNSLRQKGTVKIWVDSDEYNFVEMVHHIWLVALVDRIAHHNRTAGS